MKTLSPWAAAIVVGTAGPALACSPHFTPFSQVVDDAEFAFHGRAHVRIAQSTPISPENGEEGARLLAGEVRFTGIECYAPPRGEHHCPRSLTVPFEVLEDGHNCPSWVLWYKPERDRYFTLWRDQDKRWQLGGAWGSFDRR
jgi:hypothetical protein